MALYGSASYGTIKELLVLEFDKKSKNKELLELGLELGSLFKKVCIFPHIPSLVNGFLTATIERCSLDV